jgi:hypothetical protein
VKLSAPPLEERRLATAAQILDHPTPTGKRRESNDGWVEMPSEFG